MTESMNKLDMGGISPTFNTIYLGATKAGAMNGTEVTASAAELNIMDGVTASAAELNYVDIAALGTGAASKAVVLDAGDDYVWPATGILTYGVLKDPAGTTLSATVAELNYVDVATLGTAEASKALTLSSAKKLVWTVTDATATVTPLSLTVTATGVGASVDGAYFITATEAALGTYANALNGKLNFGTAGRVDGLGAAICAELDLGPGTTPGSYACFEAELNCPASGSTGARTSFISMNLWGVNAAAVDTSGFLFDVGGLTANTGKLLREGLSQAVTATARLRVQVNGTTYYIPLCANEALTS